jgi:TonB-dependent SusC/RagA subfamily outer membrane receptor
MLRLIVALLVAFPFFASGQHDWSKLRRKSHETFAYRIPADSAEKYIKQDSIPVDIFLSQQPSFVFKTDSVSRDSLPKGHFVLLKIVDTKIDAEIVGITDLVIYPLVNQQSHLLEIRNKKGDFIVDAKAWVNGKQTRFDKNAMNYRIRQRRLPEEPLIKVYANGDTIFLSFEYEEPRPSVLKQKWWFFKGKKVGRIVTWIPRKISDAIHGRLWRKRYKSTSIGAQGYMVFNQPKYKLTDTVKLKAYIIDKKWKQYKQKVNVYLNYYAYGSQKTQLLATLNASNPGSYLYEFPLSDTLVNDYTYSLEIRTVKKNKRVLAGSFRVEDYVLDEVAKYNFRSQKEQYVKGDSMVFFASAKDANDLPLLDAKAKLVLLSKPLNNYVVDSIYIADTLFIQEKNMLSDAETVFAVSTNQLPNANMDLEAVLQFRNSNNEIQTKTVKFKYQLSTKELRVELVGDTVQAQYYENGMMKEADGELDIDGENNMEQTIKVHYPFKIKLDAMAMDYDFYVSEKDSIIVSESLDLPYRYEVVFSRINKADTAGFILHNPYKIPVSFLILDGNRTIATGKSNDAQIVWKHHMNRRRKMYILKYDYAWKGKQEERSQNIALLYKMLNIEINSNKQIFPGQNDSIEIEVKDYKGKPVKNVNLTAASYNSQFSKSIKVPEPPYLVRYKSKPIWRRGLYKDEQEDAYLTKQYLLGKHQQWRQKFGVDSLLFYQMLFPAKPLLDMPSYNIAFMPQMNVHVVDNGQPKPVYMLYLNRQLVYYDGTTTKMASSYQVDNYYTQIGIRLLDKYIQIDSVYVQPNYKHDFVIDVNNLPAKAKVFDEPKYYTAEERSILERNIFQLDREFSHVHLWQGWKTVSVPAPSNTYSHNYGYGYGPHLLGPFVGGDSLHFFKPNNFDIHFSFEPGYVYKPSNKIVRLEKQYIFPYVSDRFPTKLPVQKDYTWTGLGDTLVAHPSIQYPVYIPQPQIKLTAYKDYDSYMPTKAGNGKLDFIIARDTSLRYVVLMNDSNKLVLDGNTRKINNQVPGNYQLILINRDWKIAKQPVIIRADTTLYVHTNRWVYTMDSSLLKLLETESIEIPKTIVQEKDEIVETPLPPIQKGKAAFEGRVMDDKGANPIPGASIVIKGSRTGVACNMKGEFSLRNISPGTYTFIIAGLGYSQKEVRFELNEFDVTKHIIYLDPASTSIEEVVVTGYGSVKKKSMSASVVSVRGESLFDGFDRQLEGRAAGVQVVSDSVRILIRGGSSVSSSSAPIYIIDGIAYDEMPKNISPDLIDKIEVVKDASSLAIYGARAANGVVVITTKTKTLRTQFRDYAFWKPEFFTDKNGKASFVVTYPDNITGWETYVLGMDKKRRIGKAMKFTKSFKPVMAQLSTPQFLIEGDRTYLIGKVFNYATDAYQLKTSFSLQDQLMNEKEMNVAANASDIASLAVETPFVDTLKASFQLKTTTGFKDGEERKIPVFKKGTEEAIGNFWVMQSDTSVSFKAANNSSFIEITALNNTLDILLEEIDYLKKYPYYCMEQTASKLRGLVMEKQIRETLKQPFKNEKELNLLLSKLQKAQHFDGSWSWWETGRYNIHITNYIINTLLPLRSNPLVETNVRNGLLFLQNQLPFMNRTELLSVLATMANAKHAMDYGTAIKPLPFDSLSLHQQWQYVRVKQQAKMDYEKEMDTLLKKAVPGMLGSLHWGEENYRWYSNRNATTVLAYEVIRNDEKHQHLLPVIVQHFLGNRRNSYWTNTVESASILSAILPDVLKKNESFTMPASLSITGDTSFVINTFPFRKKISSNNHSLQVTKTGGGITYFTLNQKVWNASPTAVTDNFVVNTVFEKAGREMAYIKSGERMKMMVIVDVKKEAEYVMLEIPIPAGCTYSSKKQDGFTMHWEYMKDKVVMFAELLTKGEHKFELELEPRYNGTYTLNPAKASLMYFPVFYGRNGMKQVEIKNE